MCTSNDKTNEELKILVKGTRFDFSESDDPLVKILEPYYWNKENFLIVTPVFNGKISAFQEIAKSLEIEKVLIITDSAYKGLDCSKPDSSLIIGQYDYIIYDNIIPKNINELKSHISIYLDYNELPCNIYLQENPNWYKEYITTLLGENNSFTYICIPPKKQKIEFLFGTNDKIKHLCLDNCLIGKNYKIFAKNPEKIDKKHTNIIRDVISNRKCTQIVFYDIDLEAIRIALDKIDHITIIYTCNFNELIPLQELFKSKKKKIPEHIQRIIENQNKSV